MESRETKRYYERKSAGLCVSCGKNVPDEGNVICNECKDKRNAYGRGLRQWRKENGICTMCGKAKAEEGYTVCLVCRMDRREISKRYPTSESGLSHQREHNKEVYERMKAEHKCVRCGKPLPVKWDKISCSICRAKQNKNQQTYDRKKGKMPRILMGNGIYCAQCGKPVEEKGSKICNACYERDVKKCQKMREKVPKDNYFAQSIKAQWNRSRANKLKYEV